MNRSRFRIAPLFVFLLPALARAQEPVREEPLNVFAERAPLVDRAGTQAVEVIGRAAIEARNPSSVPELLRDVAGVHLDRLGNAGGPSNLYIRGAEPNHTVVLVAGVRVNDPPDARGGG